MNSVLAINLLAIVAAGLVSYFSISMSVSNSLLSTWGTWLVVVLAIAAVLNWRFLLMPQAIIPQLKAKQGKNVYAVVCALGPAFMLAACNPWFVLASVLLTAFVLLKIDPRTAEMKSLSPGGYWLVVAALSVLPSLTMVVIRSEARGFEPSMANYGIAFIFWLLITAIGLLANLGGDLLEAAKMNREIEAGITAQLGKAGIPNTPTNRATFRKEDLTLNERIRVNAEKNKLVLPLLSIAGKGLFAEKLWTIFFFANLPFYAALVAICMPGEAAAAMNAARYKYTPHAESVVRGMSVRRL